jgi:glutathione S-transferase
MDELELVIGNKAYSSWSLRPWLVLKHADAKFSETRVPLYVTGYKEKLLQHAPTGKVPVLKHGAISIWDSLAICEYLAELFPQGGLWPQHTGARALARAVSAEMHSGFLTIRAVMPFNCRARNRHVPITTGLRGEIKRVEELWSACRSAHGSGGPWLFGRFTIADAMLIPMALRFVTYSVPLGEVSHAYVDAILAHPPVEEWIAASEREPEVVESYEVGR